MMRADELRELIERYEKNLNPADANILRQAANEMLANAITSAKATFRDLLVDLEAAELFLQVLRDAELAEYEASPGQAGKDTELAKRTLEGGKKIEEERTGTNTTETSSGQADADNNTDQRSYGADLEWGKT